MIDLNHRLVLNSDVVIGPVGSTPAPGLSKDAAGDFIVTRTASRSPSLAVNRETAEFLLAFSSPCSLLSAVQVIAKRELATPEAVLEDIYPSLRTFLERGLLVRTGNARRATGLRRIGAWSLERPINDFDDSSVFLVKNDSGQFGALKLIRKEVVAGVLERERRVLELAGDDMVPALLDSGSSPLGSYIVSEWKAGSVAADAFRELRSAPNSREGLLRLGITLVEAFERLHRRGIIHGDVQPKNLVFDLQGRAWIIDFSHSTVPGLPLPVWRMGVPFFFEPEHAKRLLAEPPKSHPLSIRGENYSVAAMLFYLLSGVHSIEYSLERETLLRQIAEAEPRRLTDAAGAEWDAADRAIRPFLAKDPEQRPPSLTHLREALQLALRSEAAPQSASEPRAFRIQRLKAPEQTMKTDYGLGSARLREFDVAAPRCSLTYGAAGIAYALLRAAELCEDAELLWAADAWIEQAEQRAGEPEAFTTANVELTRRRIGYASLSCAEPGLFFVKSLIRAATGDSRGARDAVDQFLSAAIYRPSHHSDVNLGGVGLALAADRLAGLSLSAGHRRKLRELRTQLIGRAWKEAPPEFRSPQRLGFAHGVAGMVVGSLTGGKSPEADEAADRLRRLPVMIRRGIKWPVRGGGDYFMPGWCNGVAGHLLMWTRVWQCSGLSEDREMMERTAWGVLESQTSLGNLCCGAAGQAVALASFASRRGRTFVAQAGRRIARQAPPAMAQGRSCPESVPGRTGAAARAPGVRAGSGRAISGMGRKPRTSSSQSVVIPPPGLSSSCQRRTGLLACLLRAGRGQARRPVLHSCNHATLK